MVSTRGIKFKFSEGERVLCYEPDPTKAKVLYDSKVLEAIVNKDLKGRKVIEYLIHFQGWNSSWDRYVKEHYVLKDTEENRKLQKDLAEKAQLQQGAYLYRREHKRHSRTDKANRKERRHLKPTFSSGDSSASYSSALDEIDDDDDDDEAGEKFDRRSEDSDFEGEMNEALEEAEDEDEQLEGDKRREKSNANNDDTDQKQGGTTTGNEDGSDSSDTDSSGGLNEQKEPLEIGDTLKAALDFDYEMVKEKCKLVILPASPNVVYILESFIQHWTKSAIFGSSDAANKKSYRYKRRNKPVDLENIRRKLNLWKEVLDGVRIYFDFTLGGLLLYNNERDQFEETKCMSIKRCNIFMGNLARGVGNKTISDGDIDTALKIEVEEPLTTNNFPNSAEDMLERSEVGSEGTDFGLLQGEGIGAMKLEAMSSDQVSSSDSFLSFNDQKVEDSAAANNSTSIAGSGFTISSPQPGISSITKKISARGNSPSPAAAALLDEILSWQMVPDKYFSQKPTPPAVVYGAIHLARLFVKLPELLSATDMPRWKLRLVLKHLEMILKYLETHTELFGEKFYKDVELSDKKNQH